MSFTTQFKIEFLPPFTKCRKVFQKMPDLLLILLLGDLFNGNTSFIVSGEMPLNTLCNSVVLGTANFYNELYTFYTSSKNLRMKVMVFVGNRQTSTSSRSLVILSFRL